MVAVGYMTELDTESIWETTLETARFDKINIRIAEQLNFWVNDDSTSQVTSTAVTPVLEQISEEILFDLLASAKLEKLTNPWNFVQANIVRISWRILGNYDKLLYKIQTKLYGRFEMVTRNLPGKNDRTY